MEVLEYFDLDVSRVQRRYNKVREQLIEGRFAELDMRKLANADLYRVKLDDTNRLLFKIAKFKDTTCLLLLEVILNHNYKKSRFLRGKEIEESDFQPVKSGELAESCKPYSLRYINPHSRSFHLLDKPISFDDTQEAIFGEELPLLIVGAAGCGKTAISVEKMRGFTGRVLYVSLSPFLVEATRRLFFSEVLDSEDADVTFLSLREFLEMIEIPAGSEISYRSFENWARAQPGVKPREARKLFEEFRGVLTGMSFSGDGLSLDEYLALGVRESIIPLNERPNVYQVFADYLRYMRREGFYDLSALCSRYHNRVEACYDVLVVDEVQDFTLAQLRVLLASLKDPRRFLLCGDAHQIVHPNLFSWAKLKSFLYRAAKDIEIPDTIRILQANFRNSGAVTGLANRVLWLKHKRFGSVDKESNYLVAPKSDKVGSVKLLRHNDTLISEVSEKIRLSTRFAVVVLSDEQKEAAKSAFKTPLVFSVHEAKGLEYDNVILFGFADHAAREYREITEGLSKQDIESDLRFARAKDKNDKSLDIFKFYINALYVAITRAMDNAIIVDREPEHPIFELLDLTISDSISLESSKSSREDWQMEARRLELQGKTEQAEEIRASILAIKRIPWKPATFADLKAQLTAAFQPNAQKKQQLAALESSAIIGLQGIILMLAESQYGFASKPFEQIADFVREKYMFEFQDKMSVALSERIRQYGINHLSALGDTPMTAAARLMFPGLAQLLLAQGADAEISNSYGFTPLRVLLANIINFESMSAKQGERVERLYGLIAPSSLRVKIGDRLVKLDRSKSEFIVVQLLLVASTILLFKRRSWHSVVTWTATDVCDLLSKCMDGIVPPYRKRAQYLSGVLIRNEIDSNAPYNKQLFHRIFRGEYILNPMLDIEVQGVWMPWYRATKLDEFLDAAQDVPRIFGSQHTVSALDDIRAMLMQRSEPSSGRSIVENRENLVPVELNPGNVKITG